MTVCMTVLRPPAGLLVTTCGVDMGPLAMVMPEMDPGLHQPWGLMVQYGGLV